MIKTQKIQVILLISIFLFMNINGINTDNKAKAENITFEKSDSIALEPSNDSNIKKHHPNDNFGSVDKLNTRNTYGAGGTDNWGEDIMIMFDVSNFTENYNVTNATLGIYYYDHEDSDPAGRTIYCYRNLESWNESNVTWNNSPSFNNTESATGTVPSSHGSWMEINVTKDVKSFVNGTLTNYGWRLIDADVWGAYNIPIAHYRSKEYGSYVPYLNITYNIIQEIEIPNVTTNESTDVEETIAILNGYLKDDGGENCSVWFEWGYNNSYGNSTRDFIEGSTEIWTIEDLNGIKSNLSDNYILMRNLDFNDNDSYDDPDHKAGYTTGSGWGPIGTSNPFTGTLDGNGYSISNLYCHRTASMWCYSGMFEETSEDAVIKNLGLINVSVSADDTWAHAGGLVAENYGTIKNCYVTGNTTSTGSIYTWSGLIVAENEGGTILNSFAKGNVSALVGSSKRAGVLIGEMDGGTISNCYSTGTSNDDAMIGSKQGGSVTNCFYNSDLASGGSGTGKNTTEMKDFDTYNNAGWEITNKEFTAYTWSIDDGNEYPKHFFPRIMKGYNFTYKLTSLSPGHLYHFRAVANNSAGEVYGNDSTFLTKPYEPTNLIATVHNSTQINLTWTKGIGANKTYIERNATGSTIWSKGDGVEIYNGTADRYEDMGLIYNNTYYYQIWSYTNWTYNPTLHQWSNNNESVNITILETAPEIFTNESTGVKETNATIWGYLNYDGSFPCNVSFQWGKTTSYGNWTVEEKEISGKYEFNYNITSLEEGEIYHYRAVANNSLGSSYGVDRIFLTKPLKPTNLTTILYGYNTINLTWDKGIGANKTCIERRIKPLFFPTPWNRGDYGEVYNGTGETFNDTGLEFNKVYQYQIWSYIEKEGLYQYSDYFDSGNETTADIESPTVASLSYENLGETSITVNGYLLDDGNVSCSVWFVYSKDQSFSLSTTHETNKQSGYYFEANLTGLDPGSLYYYKAVAENLNGTSYGNALTFITKPNEPINLQANAYNSTVIHLSWTKGNGANDTVIERNTIENWTKGSGTEIYVGENNSYQDLNLNENQTYYYQTWSRCTWFSTNVFSDNYSEANETTEHKPNVTSTYPMNGQKGIPVDIGQLNATIIDKDGGSITWSIETSPNVGSNSGVVSGTNVTCPISTLSCGAVYNWWVNLSCGNDAESYRFNFSANSYPQIYGERPTNNTKFVSLNRDTVNATIADTDGDYIIWTIETLPDVGSNTTGIPQNSGDKMCGISGLQYNTTYKWFVNVTDGKLWTNKTYLFSTNYFPSMSTPSPTNGGVSLPTPNCTINVDDPENETIVVKFYENTTGSWVLQKTQYVNTESSHQATFTYLNATDTMTYYWWKVIVEDNHNGSVENTYMFRTNNPMHIFNEQPYNDETNVRISLSQINITINNPDGAPFNWSITTSPNIGNASGNNEGNGTKICNISGLNYGTNYEWTVDVEDGDDENSTTFEFTTSTKPTLNLVAPLNNSITALIPVCSVTTFDIDGGIGNISFYENTTGFWVLQTTIQKSLSTLQQTNWTYNNATTYLQKYWWRAKVTDDGGNYIEKTFCFTPSNNAPIVTSPSPSNNSQGINKNLSDLVFTITDLEGDLINWTIETSPNIGSNIGFEESNGTKICPVSGLLKNTTYKWYINASAGGPYSTNITYIFTTTKDPTISNEYPLNNTESNVKPICSVKVYDEDGGYALVSFYENTTGSWVLQKSEYVAFGTPRTVYWNYYNNASGVNQSYWWKVNVDDQQGGVIEGIYKFTTDDSPSIFNENPEHGSYGIPQSLSYLNVTIEDPNGDQINWSIETNPDIGSNSANEESNGTKSCSISGLSVGQTYTWYVNASDSDDTTSKVYNFTVSGAPYVTQIYFPVTPIPVETELSVKLSDPDYDNVTVKIYENTTGSWILQKTEVSNYSVEDIEYTYINATEYSTKYWLKVNLSDGKGGFFEDIYNFTTVENYAPTISDPSPSNNSIGVAPGTNSVRITISDSEDNFNYTIETSPNVGSVSETNETSESKICPLSKLSFNTTYIWWVNVTDGRQWTNETYNFKTGFNEPILISNPTPINLTDNIDLSYSQLTIDFTEPNGDPIQWSIETSPDVGSNSGGAASNGTKTCLLSGLSEGIVYKWFVNATDGYQYKRKIYYFTTSHNPIIISYYPENNSEGVGQEPECKVTVDDPDETYDSLIIEWWELYGGEWKRRQISQNLTSLPCTRTWNYSHATDPAETYWWKVIVYDEKGCSVTGIYNFMPTANEKPNLYFPNPSNGETNVDPTISYLNVTVDDREDDIITWSITTNPNIGSNSGVGDPEGNLVCPVSSLSYGTTYTWHINVTDELGSKEWRNNTYTFTTSYWPAVTNPYPINNARSYLTPECSIKVYDGDGGTVNVKFYENTTGSWKLQQESNVVASPQNTVTWLYNNATVFGNKYYWRVNVSDSDGHYINNTYAFFTNKPPTITSPNPSNNSENIYLSTGLLEVDIEDPEGDFMDWTIQTKPYVGSGFGNDEINGTKNCAVFNLKYCTVYTWYINVTDGVNSINRTYTFKTECKPVIIDIIPDENETGIRLKPNINLTIYDENGEDVEVKFQENTTGSWVQKYQQTVDATIPKNITWNNYGNADYYGTWYWWRAICTDEHNNILIKTFKFRTVDNNHPVLSNQNPADVETNVDLTKSSLSLDLSDQEGHKMNWTIQTSPNIGSSSGVNKTNGSISCSISGLEAEKTYKWFVNVSDGYNWTNESYAFTTTTKTIIRNPTPVNNSIDVNRWPTCTIEVLDLDGDEVAVEFFRYWNGNWISEQINSTINASDPVVVVWDRYNKANNYSSNYLWKVVVYDEKNSQNESIFKFRTIDNNHPQILDIDPNNGARGISAYKQNVSVTVTDQEGHYLNVTIHGQYLYTNVSNNVNNGTYRAQTTQRLPYSSNLKWYVNITDGYNWTNATYNYYTENDTIKPEINSVSADPHRAKRNSLIVIQANVTDNDEVDYCEVVFPSLGTRYLMFDSGNNIYGYENNFTILGTYLFYIYAVDVWGNENISSYYNFTIVAKEVKMKLHTTEYANKLTDNKMVISLSNAYTGNQITNKSQNISCYISTQDGFIILNGTKPAEIAPGIYEINFSLTNKSGSFIAWILLGYNSSQYMAASAFEIKYFAYENISDISKRLNDLVTLSKWVGTNSSREIIEHIHQSSETTKDISENLEKSGITSRIEETAISQMFSWAFMGIFLITVFIFATLMYGKRKAARLAKKVANLPSAAVGWIAGESEAEEENP